MQKMTMIRIHKLDLSHRVMNERVKCFNLHGHRVAVEIHCSFTELNSIGYALDFKEMKRVALSYLDKRFDHAHVGNPRDVELNQLCKKNGWKLHEMNLMGPGGDCNPSAENISKELFFAASKLLDDPTNCDLHVSKVVFYETENCWVECTKESFSDLDWQNLESSEFAQSLQAHKKAMGVFEYDLRKVSDPTSDKHIVDSIDN